MRCPHCGSEKYRTLKSNCSGRVTRCCEQHVVTVDKVWYAELDDAPLWRILSAFADGVGGQDEMDEFEFSFGDYNYQGWLRGAKTLLKRCGGDCELALEVIRLAFNDKRWAWRTYTTFYALLNNKLFGALLAAAKSQATRREEAEIVQDRSEAVFTQRELDLAYATATI